MQLRKWLLTSIHLFIIVGFSHAISHHIMDTSWKLHARNHAFQAALWLIGLHSLCIVILWNAYPQRWACYTLGFVYLLFFAGYFLAIVVLPKSGAPGITDDIIIASFGLIYLTTLLSSKPQET